jgi:acetyl-CoA acyltransferase 1
VERLGQLNKEFSAQQTFNSRTVGPKHDDDIVLVSFARTAMTRAKKGPQKDTAPEAMLAPVLKDVLKKANNMDPKLVQEICIGNVLQPGAGSTSSRMAQFLAGIPNTTPLYAIDRLCSSGLQAVASIANSIRAGEIDIGIGGGVESMSMFAMTNMVDPGALSDLVFEHEEASKCLMPMGLTSENVVEKYGITRAQ